jgi:hypothetical protein
MRRYALLPILSIFILCNTNVLYAESNKITLTGVDPAIINAIDNWLMEFFRHNVPKGNVEIRYNEHQEYWDPPGYRIYKAQFAKLLKAYNDISLANVTEILPLNMPFLEWKNIKRYAVEPTKKCIDSAEEVKENGDCIILMARPGMDSVTNTKNMLFRSNDPNEYKIITGTFKVNKFSIGEEYNSASGGKIPNSYKIRALVSIGKISKDCNVKAVDWGDIGEDVWITNNIATFIANLSK